MDSHMVDEPDEIPEGYKAVQIEQTIESDEEERSLTYTVKVGVLPEYPGDHDWLRHLAEGLGVYLLDRGAETGRELVAHPDQIPYAGQADE